MILYFAIGLLTVIAIAVKGQNEFVERGQRQLDKLRKEDERATKEQERTK